MRSEPVEQSQKQPQGDAPPVVEQMRTGQDRRKRLIRAGLFSVIGLVILVIGVFFIGEKQNLFSNTFVVQANFKTVEGLKGGALVTVNGIKVGTVSQVSLMLSTKSGTYVHVEMIIDVKYREFVRSSTVATVGSTGIIGDKLIELKTLDATGPIVADGATITAAEPQNYAAILDEMNKVVKSSQGITSSLDTLFLRFRRGEGTLGKLLTDDKAYTSLTSVMNATEKLMNQTGTQLGSITATLNSASGNVNAITDEGRKLIADIGNGKGSLGALLYDRSVYDSLEQLLGTLNHTASDAAFAAREFGLNMRGLRSNWLVGGLFNGGESEQNNAELRTRELELRLEELRRQKELLDKREREMMQREKTSSQ